MLHSDRTWRKRKRQQRRAGFCPGAGAAPLLLGSLAPAQRLLQSDIWSTLTLSAIQRVTGHSSMETFYYEREREREREREGGGEREKTVRGDKERTDKQRERVGSCIKKVSETL
ncbi:hypothetical protein WMY93_033894 [Mugilogobius chulae]|uniref:Uncharacterized protein n=1 Tax=Mugilogobius chulae TaxID=88201 RepID=A0AAW0MIR7_9GOBI